MKRSRYRQMLVAIGILLLAAHAAAQETEIPLGTRLRVSTPGIASTAPLKLHVGLIIELDASSVALVDAHGHRAAFDRTEVVRVERSDGRPSRARRVGLGLLIGFAAGAMVGAMSGDDCSRPGIGPCFPPGAVALGLGLFGGGIGMGIGAALPVHERWHDVTLWAK